MGLRPLAVFVLLCLFPMSSEAGLYFRCPFHPCLCESGDMGLVMNCRQRFLTRIPPAIPSDLLFHEISLKKNNIRHLGPQVFKGIKVKKVDLSENIITSIDDDAFEGVEDILEELVIQVYNMKGFPLKALRKLNVLKVLHVIGCKVPILTNATFSAMPTVEEIRLISCGIAAVEPDAFLGLEATLKVLDFFGNNLKTVPSVALVGLESVEKMVMTGNQLKKIDKKALLGMVSLRHLELSSNSIKSIHPMAFDGIQTSLEFLGLQRNHLRANDLVALRTLRNLNQLELAYNKIEGIPKRLFRNLNRVTLIGLQSNKIQEINRLTFAGTERQLKVLLLSDNDVNTIAPNTFEGFRRLRHLYLDRTNAGKGLSRRSFRGLAGSLETLNMQRSGFTASGFQAISDLGELKTLVLRDNQITSMLPRAFTKFRRLTRLDLQGNKLESITNPETFQGLEKSLRQLVLSNNMISTLSECVFEKFEQLRDIVLNQNPLQCDCQILWLKEWVISKTSAFSRNTLNWICAGPRQHAGKLFRSVKDEEMVCQEGSNKERCPVPEPVQLQTTTVTTNLMSPSTSPSSSEPTSTDRTVEENIATKKISTPPLNVKSVGEGELSDDPPKMQLLLPNIDDPIFRQDSFYNDIIQRTVQLMASKIDDNLQGDHQNKRGRHRFKKPLNQLITTPSRSRKRTLARWLSSTRKMYTKPIWSSRRPVSRQNKMTATSLKSQFSSTISSERWKTESPSNKVSSMIKSPPSTMSQSATKTLPRSTSISDVTLPGTTAGHTTDPEMMGHSIASITNSTAGVPTSSRENVLQRESIENPFLNLTSAAASGRIRSTSHGLNSKKLQNKISVLHNEQNFVHGKIKPNSDIANDMATSPPVATTPLMSQNSRHVSLSTTPMGGTFQQKTTEIDTKLAEKNSITGHTLSPTLDTHTRAENQGKNQKSEKSLMIEEVPSQRSSKHFNTTDDETHDNVTYRSKLGERNIVNNTDDMFEPARYPPEFTGETKTTNESVEIGAVIFTTGPVVVTRTVERKLTRDLSVLSKVITGSWVETSPNPSNQNVYDVTDDVRMSGVTRDPIAVSGVKTTTSTDAPTTLITESGRQKNQIYLSTPTTEDNRYHISSESEKRSTGVTSRNDVLRTEKVDVKSAMPAVTIISKTTPQSEPLQPEVSVSKYDHQNLSITSNRKNSTDPQPDLSPNPLQQRTGSGEKQSAKSSADDVNGQVNSEQNLDKPPLKTMKQGAELPSSATRKQTRAPDGLDRKTNNTTSASLLSMSTSTAPPDKTSSTHKISLSPDNSLSKSRLRAAEHTAHSNTLIPNSYLEKNGAKSTRFPTPTPAHDPTSVVKPSKPTSLEPNGKTEHGLRDKHEQGEIDQDYEKFNMLRNTNEEKILDLLSKHLLSEAKRKIKSSNISKIGGPAPNTDTTIVTQSSVVHSDSGNITTDSIVPNEDQNNLGDGITKSADIPTDNSSPHVTTLREVSSTPSNIIVDGKTVTAGNSTPNKRPSTRPQPKIDSRNPYSKGEVESKHLYTGKPRTRWRDMSVIKTWLNSALAGEARKYANSSSKGPAISTPSLPLPNHDEGRIKNPYEILRNFKRLNSRLNVGDTSDTFRRKNNVQGNNELTLHTTMPIPSVKTNSVEEQKAAVNIQKDRAGLEDALDETSGTRSTADSSLKNRDNHGTEETSEQPGSTSALPTVKPGPVESNKIDRKDQKENSRPSDNSNTNIGAQLGRPVPENRTTIDLTRNENSSSNNTGGHPTLLTQTRDTSELSQISTTLPVAMDPTNTSSTYNDKSKQNATVEELLAVHNASQVDRYTIPDFAIFVSVLPYASDAVKVTWNVSHDYAVSRFRVYYGDAENETLVEGPALEGTVRTYDVTSLVSEEKYTFCVVAYLVETDERKSGQCKEAKINFEEEHAHGSSREKTKTLALIIGSYGAGALVLMTLLLAIALLVRRYRDKTKTGLYVPRSSPYWIEFLCGGIATSRYSTTVLDSSTATVSSGVEMSENDSHSDSDESGTYSFDYSLRSLPAQHIWSTADLHTNLYTY